MNNLYKLTAVKAILQEKYNIKVCLMTLYAYIEKGYLAPSYITEGKRKWFFFNEEAIQAFVEKYPVLLAGNKKRIGKSRVVNKHEEFNK